jgi:hypothetical protein
MSRVVKFSACILRNTTDSGFDHTKQKICSVESRVLYYTFKKTDGNHDEI